MKGDNWQENLLPSQRRRIDGWLHVRERNRMSAFRKFAVAHPWPVFFAGLLVVVTLFYAAVRYELVETVLTWVKP